MAKTEYTQFFLQKYATISSPEPFPSQGTVPPFSYWFKLRNTIDSSFSLRVHSLFIDNYIGSTLKVDPKSNHCSPSPLIKHHLSSRQCNCLITGLPASTFVWSNPPSKTTFRQCSFWKNRSYVNSVFKTHLQLTIIPGITFQTPNHGWQGLTPDSFSPSCLFLKCSTHCV